MNSYQIFTFDNSLPVTKADQYIKEHGYNLVSTSQLEFDGDMPQKAIDDFLTQFRNTNNREGYYAFIGRKIQP